VRAGFILGAGLAWRAADQTAAEIIESAFRRLGVERPSWLAGQPEFVEPIGGARFTCVRCGKAMPELAPQYAGRALYCGKVCAEAARTECKKAMGVQVDRATDLARRAAEKAARRKERERPCVVCGKTFVPDRPSRLACSNKCGCQVRYVKG
jgi:hypothetical protein